MKDKKTLRIGFIGLGERGRTALRLMVPVEGAEVAALCDVNPANLMAAKKLLAPETAGNVRCISGTKGYMTLCQAEDLDLIYICTDWTSHTQIALAAMNGGKDVAVEVPAAQTMEDIQALAATAQDTRRQLCMMENVCFDSQVMEAVAAIRRGDIGNIVHAEGNYYHCLGERWTAWRLETNSRFRGDLYPTHEMGPICQAMDIGGSDRLQTLVCMDSTATAGQETYEAVMRQPAPDFKNGDHTTTLIRTARGRTILLKHDVMTQQPYERRLTFIGTRGRITLDDAGHESHEAMTLNMNRTLVNALRGEHAFGITVADMATWCATIPLSALSIERGFAPVSFPDFY